MPFQQIGPSSRDQLLGVPKGKDPLSTGKTEKGYRDLRRIRGRGRSLDIINRACRKRHRDRLPRYLGDVRKPGFANLLQAAGFIKIHDDVWFFGVEISRRVVEGDVAVFTDAQKCDVYRL